MLHEQRGYTLLEIIIVLIIILLLASVAYAALFLSRDKANDAKNLAELREIELAVKGYFEYNSAWPTVDTSGGETGEVGIGESIDAQLEEFISTAPDNGYFYDPSFECDDVDHHVVMTTRMFEGKNANFSSVCTDGGDDSPPAGDENSTHIILLD